MTWDGVDTGLVIALAGACLMWWHERSGRIASDRALVYWHKVARYSSKRADVMDCRLNHCKNPEGCAYCKAREREVG